MVNRFRYHPRPPVLRPTVLRLCPHHSVNRLFYLKFRHHMANRLFYLKLRHHPVKVTSRLIQVRKALDIHLVNRLFYPKLRQVNRLFYHKLDNTQLDNTQLDNKNKVFMGY